MKRILITGKDSYIGTNFKKYIEQYPNDYYVEELDVRNESWKIFDFSEFDVVFHVAGIAHIKEKQKNRLLYLDINCCLTNEIANLSKKQGVRQFIYISSMSVYGLNCCKNVITIKNSCIPNTYYGESKYFAEKILNSLEEDNFKICILRPPMVYGNTSPGNLNKLFKAVKFFRVFPTIRNQRSTITIQNLSKYVIECIDNDLQGIHLPQNDEYMCTVDIVKEKMENDNIKVIYIPIFNPIIRLLIGKIGVISKCFGDLMYEK